MFDTFREPHFFTFSVIFSHIASIFTFSVEFFSHLATFSHIAAFSHLRVPQACPNIGYTWSSYNINGRGLSDCGEWKFNRSIKTCYLHNTTLNALESHGTFLKASKADHYIIHFLSQVERKFEPQRHAQCTRSSAFFIVTAICKT